MRNYFDNSVKRAPKVETFSSISRQAGPERETISSRFEVEFEAEFEAERSKAISMQGL